MIGVVTNKAPHVGEVAESVHIAEYLGALEVEVVRLQRIEAAARAVVAPHPAAEFVPSYESMCALRDALEEKP